MAKRTLSEIRAELSQAMEDFESNKITEEEVDNIHNRCSEELKAFNKKINELKKHSKSKKDTVIEATIVDPLKLTDSDILLAKKIKEKLRKTAETIVEIGEDIAKAIDKKPYGFRKLFYERIGMSSRSAQRYMQIAKHVKVQELKQRNELEGKTMTDLVKLISQESITTKPVSAVNVANSFYSRYKDNPDTLEKIMKELQRLIDNAP